uniref:Delta-like protein n=1 Tax=Magallana gigas TaxID=29159 RepID=K1PXU0_MAGGI
MQRTNGTTLEQHKFGPIFQMRVHNVVAASSTESYYLFAAHPPDIDCIDLDTPVNRPLDISLLWVTQPVDYRCNYECRVCFINDRVLKFCSGKSVVNLVVESTGKLTIKLYSYDNVQGTTYDGECCDSDVKKCLLDKCDLKFDICVGKHIDGSYDCTYGTKQVISPPDMNSIEFTDVFNFAITNSLKEDLFIRVNVTDQDSEEATDLVDAFHFKYSRTAFFNSSLAEYMDYFIRGERKNNPTRLNFSLASYCDQNYYGEDCSINCVPEDFGCNGHYRCGADGAKICLPGWKGPNCDIQIPGGEGDCSFYKGTCTFQESEGLMEILQSYCQAYGRDLISAQMGLYKQYR